MKNLRAWGRATETARVPSFRRSLSCCAVRAGRDGHRRPRTDRASRLHGGRACARPARAAGVLVFLAGHVPGACGTGVALTGGGLGPPGAAADGGRRGYANRASTGSTRDHSRHWFCEAARTEFRALLGRHLRNGSRAGGADRGHDIADGHVFHELVAEYVTVTSVAACVSSTAPGSAESAARKERGTRTRENRITYPNRRHTRTAQPGNAASRPGSARIRSAGPQLRTPEARALRGGGASSTMGKR